MVRDEKAKLEQLEKSWRANSRTVGSNGYKEDAAGVVKGDSGSLVGMTG